MTLSTSLSGRLRNTSLPKSHGLLPLFEAVVNSIQSIDAAYPEGDSGKIAVEITRLPQLSLFESGSRGERGPAPQEPILSFKVTDNGAGFHNENMLSFETLDSEYKAEYGCRGVGRLLWLKAFQKVEVSSVFLDKTGHFFERSFSFTADKGVTDESVAAADSRETGATVTLSGFRAVYRDTSPKNLSTIARNLLEHCLWYFVRPGGCPDIIVIDGDEQINLTNLFAEHMLSSAQTETLTVKEQKFDLVHLKVRSRAGIEPQINWCAANRVVLEEKIADKIPGLHGRLNDGDTPFVYCCYATSNFLDENVRSERTGFDIPEDTEGTILAGELGMSEIRAAILRTAEEYLGDLLNESKQAGRARVENFVNHKAPRYRPILRHLDQDKLCVSPEISERELELLLHRQLWDLETELLAEGQEVLRAELLDDSVEQQERLREYLEKVDDVKKSDLAAYVSKRRVVLDMLAKAIAADQDGRYVREDVIHNLIMPMRKTSDDVPLDVCNLWIIDERLAFHNYLASDKPLATSPITESPARQEPDLLALQVCDSPMLVAEGTKLPLASIIVVEIKRPMRADSKQDGGPISQALGYLDKVRQGKVRTTQGRPIPASDQIPGFCYVISDLTPSVVEHCRMMGLRMTQDKLGFFGYNENYKAYIEVISFDRLLNAASERNRAFFDKLGLPV
ncbi:ATP-binding protein [Micromonospora sp. NPDC047740]|uniref:ATP-binding protein n=1 Tax=Micromonospora sp. NPDC047740 TaxID=3364254 RepID=UPI003717FF7F